MSYKMPGVIPIGIPKPPQPKPKKKKKKPVVEKATADFYSFIGSKPEPYDKEKFDMALSLAKRTDFYEEKLGEGRYPFLDRDINEEILSEEMAAKIRRQIYEEILSLFGAEKEVLDIVDPQEIKSNISQIIELDKKITEALPPSPKPAKRVEELQESVEAAKETVQETKTEDEVIPDIMKDFMSKTAATKTPSVDDLGLDTTGTGQSALEGAVDAGMSQEDTTAVQAIQNVEFAKETLAELKVDRIKRQATLLPPLPPNSEFFTIDKEIDRLFIILSPSTGRIRKKFPPSLFLKDWEMVRQELSKEKFQEFGDFSTPNEMLFSGIERPAAYEVLKLNEKPTKISDFLKAQKILVDPDLGIYEDHNIKTNHKYYYAFRSIEKDNTLTEEINDGLISYISDPIEVELVNEGNISFLTTKPLLLNEEEKKHYVKTFRRRIRIQPSLLQTIPVKTERDIGNLDDSSFDPKNKFKVRLTSSKTGRKIDLNIKFVKNKLKQAVPPEGAKRLIDLTKPKTIPTDTGPVEKEEKTFDIDGTIKVSVDGKEYDITNAKTDIPGVVGKAPAITSKCKGLNTKDFDKDDNSYAGTKFFCDKYLAEDCDFNCKSKYTAFLTNKFFLIPKRKYIICTYEKSPGKCYYVEK